MSKLSHKNRLTRVYHDQTLNLNDIFFLSDLSFRHLVHALRYIVGDQFIVFDGKGKAYHATIEDITKKQLTAKINSLHQQEAPPPLDIHLAIGLSKGDRMDWIMQKSAEMGVSRITPLLTQHTSVRLNHKHQQKKWLHWQNVLISACEQSGRCHLVTLEQPISLIDWLSQREKYSSGFYFDQRATISLIKQEAPKHHAIDLVIGPEGGLSQEERERLNQHGLIATNIGPRILRTETAPVAALAIIQSQWGDWR